MSFNTFKVRALMTLMTILVSIILTMSIQAQSGVSRIIGTVTDQNGAAVPGATLF